MSFTITHVSGLMERNPSLEILPRLLDELQTADEEHGDVSLTHETEWCLSISKSGSVYFENLEVGEPRHMHDVSREKILEMMECLSRGKIENIHRENWLPGYK
jgi:hypothetical protein